jgi:HEAT repeats
VRSETAYTLGQLGTPASLDRLEAMLDDAYPDARFNAAVALAHHGRAKAVATLAEMLDPTETTESQRAESAQARAANRTQTLSGALSAVEELAKQNPAADMTPVIGALKKLTSTQQPPSTNKATGEPPAIDPQIIAAAEHTLEVLERKQ